MRLQAQFQSSAESVHHRQPHVERGGGCTFAVGINELSYPLRPAKPSVWVEKCSSKLASGKTMMLEAAETADGYINASPLTKKF